MLLGSLHGVGWGDALQLLMLMEWLGLLGTPESQPQEAQTSSSIAV